MVFRVKCIHFITVSNFVKRYSVDGEGVGESEVGSIPWLESDSVVLRLVAVVGHRKGATVEGGVDEVVATDLDDVRPCEVLRIAVVAVLLGHKGGSCATVLCAVLAVSNLAALCPDDSVAVTVGVRRCAVGRKEAPHADLTSGVEGVRLSGGADPQLEMHLEALVAVLEDGPAVDALLKAGGAALVVEGFLEDSGGWRGRRQAAFNCEGREGLPQLGVGVERREGG